MFFEFYFFLEDQIQNIINILINHQATTGNLFILKYSGLKAELSHESEILFY